ncbi:hypothetical protein NW249_26035 [Streptomyces sp. OUCMDZ-4982]|uniref:hypothetical protein n=1 Tax=Streptomyces sp. OUCMDZ-4982 TaxID=2973090 RepID=UPI00215BC01E|nr:hypothetical protein [Streptomyces sp. OUCMDZ-4982]MCR8945571.1 hypothetical protein [Streptomyces sp. OUCMDZ-4982]
MVLLFALRICVVAGRRSEITGIGLLSADTAEQGDQMGRPLGALKGRTKQADEFALWLREVTEGVAVRTLEQHFPYGKSSWSEFRDSSRLPRQQLVKQVTARYLREPAMKARPLARGTSLLAAAHQAAKDLDRDGMHTMPLPGPRAAGSDPVAEAYLRLDDARLMQIEAMRQLAASERRREKLEDMVSVLEERCTLLEGERDRAREDAQAELQHELQMSTEYRRQADEKLEHARRAEKRAYELRLAAEKQVTRERIVLRRMDQETRHVPPPSQHRSPWPKTWTCHLLSTSTGSSKPSKNNWTPKTMNSTIWTSRSTWAHEGPPEKMHSEPSKATSSSTLRPSTEKMSANRGRTTPENS